ncbi:hypothetical protein PAAG_11409 [Paracoccidioides lutzii Pb01]|uniref:Mid2 domain-containing protein n=1 Tax=Paracoccidioides lutzii (strain ATCC MYA-826 / Pb01) TaxID=502779 RepID=A0A0A2VLV0_PARBA|nr:hypothetical protein PAAG_11409 [Paracoccidioides lutzii Pb01]KGQ01834.1 hypothetical protein PAAG_11409 [Paracoccidioides lutzii Pb01]
MSGNTSKITCYDTTGSAFWNNTKCPDSDSCCQTVGQCRPDRLCTSNNDPNTLVRATCKYFPWSNNCAKVCINDNDIGTFLPRVNICADGSYCCVKDSTCCIDKRGLFLNHDGSIKSRANQTIDSTTLMTSPFATSAMSSTYSKAPQSTPPGAAPPSSGLSQEAKIGIGFGISFGLVLLLVFVLFVWRTQKNKRFQPNPSAFPTYGATKKRFEIPVELPTPDRPRPQELG